MTTQLYVGDCQDTLRKLPMNSAHVCVTSPPYWGKRAYTDNEREHGIGSLDAWVCDVADTFDLVRNVLAPDGLLWCVVDDTAVGSGGAGGDYNDGGSKAGAARYRQGDAGRIPRGSLAGAPGRLEIEMQARGWILRSRIVWVKGAGITLEDIVTGERVGPPVVHPELSRESIVHVRRPKHAYEIVQMWSPDMRYVFSTSHLDNPETLGDVWLGPSASGDNRAGYKAKAPFPEWLVARALKLSTFGGETVLDPYAGACTTLKVAQDLGLDAIGCDIDEDAVRAARLRLIDCEVIRNE